MSDAHPALLTDLQLVGQCDLERLKRSGPGGQRRNKVETAVRLRHRPSGLIAEASERRSAAQNQAVALSRLRRLLAIHVRSAAAPERPSALWVSRCVSGRIALSPQHADVPAMLTEALDHLKAADWDLAAAARRLQVSGTQLTRLLKMEPAALEALNARRRDRGLRPLK